MRRAAEDFPIVAKEVAHLLDSVERAGLISRMTGEVGNLELYAKLLYAEASAGRALSRADAEGVRPVIAHIEDCLGALELVPGTWCGLTGVDLGSGYGLPGLVLALARPLMARLVLVEASSRKVAFLRRAVLETHANAQILKRRVHTGRSDPSPLSSTPKGDEGFDMVFARALAGPSQTVDLALQFMGSRSTLLYWFGRRDSTRTRELKEVCGRAGLTVEFARPEMLESRGWIAIIRREG